MSSDPRNHSLEKNALRNPFTKLLDFFQIVKAPPSINDAEKWGEIIQFVDYKLGTCFYYVDYVLLEMKEVMMCGGPQFHEILLDIDQFYLGKYFTMILHREHETIMSVDALTQMSLRDNCDYLFVSSHHKVVDTMIHESKHTSDRFHYMKNVAEAVKWTKKNKKPSDNGQFENSSY